MRLARASPTALSGRGVSWDPQILDLSCWDALFLFFSCTWKYQHDAKYFDHVLGIPSSLWLSAGGWKTCWGKIGLWFVPEIKRRILDSSEWYLRWMSNELTDRLDWCIHTQNSFVLSDLFACVLKTQLLVVPVLRLYQSWLIFAPVNEEAWHQSALKPKVRPIIPKKRLGQTRPRPLLGFCDNPRCWIS